MQREQSIVRKMVFYTLALLLVYVLETVREFPNSFFGYRIDVLPCVMVTVALLDGPVEGAIMGLIVGIFYDLGFTSVAGVYPIYYMLFGLLVGFLGRRLFRRSFPSQLLLTAAAVVLLRLLQYLVLLVTERHVEFSFYWQQMGIGLGITLLFSPLVYLLFWKISKRFRLYNG